MLRAALCTYAAASITLTLAGCQDAARPVSATPTTSSTVRESSMLREGDESAPLVRHLVAPRATDPAIDVFLADNYVWLDSTARGNPKLLVFMPGTRNVPAGWVALEKVAARLGYHVIGLSYWNDVGVDVACKDSPDRDCSVNLRLEIIDGIDRSSLVNVTPANSIDNRLTRLLVYLDAQYPDEGWSRFLEDGQPKWSQIAVSGQSQGAGQAALIGKLRHVDRVVMFSGPTDARVPDETDAWISIGATPAVKYFGLVHKRDPFVGILPNLLALDMGRFGAPVVPELSEPPYGGTHILVTDLLPATGTYLGADGRESHRSTARDGFTPLDANGTPLLRDAWRYLLGAH